MAEPDDRYTEQPGPTDSRFNNDDDAGDVEMAEGEEDDASPHSPASSSVYSNDDPLLHPFLSSLYSPLYTQSESGIPDNNHDHKKSFDFLDEVLLDLDAWLDAGGLEMGGLHDDMGEEEYR
ncbi:uncharacterized protein J4E84_009089, partial [Alternaria hordeiaustralica]|uniref:uncharacterized protein n=1 Tax=Alternaria hordeiaustralica TaxID=1187925 RepID=UPI0020C22118